LLLAQLTALFVASFGDTVSFKFSVLATTREILVLSRVTPVTLMSPFGLMLSSQLIVTMINEMATAMIFKKFFIVF